MQYAYKLHPSAILLLNLLYKLRLPLSHSRKPHVKISLFIFSFILSSFADQRNLKTVVCN